MKQATLGNGLQTVGNCAFYSCANLEKVTFENNLKTIGSSAFASCPKLAEVHIPDSVTTIGTSAFYNCTGLKNAVIGKNVSGIDPSVFGGCTALAEVTVHEENSNLSSVEGALFDKAQTKLILYPKAKAGAYTIPDTVTEIGVSAFANCAGLTEITIGSGVQTIGTSAFSGCTVLARAEIKNGANSIGNSAFYNCDKLETVIIPGSVKTIGNNAFDNCDILTTVSLGEGLETINYRAFYNCRALKEVKLPDSIKTVGEQSFYNCYSIETLDLGKGITSIGHWAFYNCDKLTELTIPDSVQTIGDYVFYDCSALKQVTLGNGLKTIGTNVFYYCPISTVYCYENSYGHTYAKSLSNAEIYFIKKDFQISGLTVSSLSSESVALKWSKPNGYDNVKEYIIYRDRQEVGKTTDLTYTESGLTTGQEYRYEVAAVDTDGNISPRVMISVIPACPEIQSIGMPGGAFKIGGTQPIRITAAMDNTLAFIGGTGKFYYSGDRENWTLIGEARPMGSEREYIVDWTLTGLSSGTYIVKFIFTDADGASKEKTVSVEVDRTPPEQIFGFAAFADVTNVKLSWGIAAEFDTNIYRIYRKADNETDYRLITEIRNRDTLNYTDKNVSENTTYEYYIVGVDEFNQESKPTDPVRILLNQDADAPRVTKLSPASGSVIGGSQWFSVTAVDNIAVTKIELYYSLDNKAWILLDTAEAASYSKYVDTSRILDGIIYYKALAYDKAGNVSDGTPVYTIKVDNTGPEKVKGTAVSSITATTATLSWQDVVDDDRSYFVVEMKNASTGEFSEYSRTSTKLGMNLSGLKPDTEYTFRVAAYDKTGNRGVVSDEIVFITLPDTTVPVITNIRPVPGYYNEQIPLNIRVWDDSAVGSIVIQVSNDLNIWKDVYAYTLPDPQKTPSINYKLDLSNYDEGALYIRAVATDVAGNQSASGSTAPYSQYIVDKTAPASPASLQALPQNGVIELRWTQENEDCASYTLYRSTSPDEEFVLLADNIKALNYFDRKIDSKTTYYYQLKAKDYAGNTSGFSAVVSAQMEKDTQPPEILSISPAAGNSIGVGYHTVSVLAQDNNRLSSISIQYKTTGDYVTLVTKENINESSQIVKAEIPLDGLKNGAQITIRAVAADLFGNQSSETNAVAVYTVDKTAPMVTQLTAVAGEENITLSWTGGQEADLAGYRIYRRTAGSSTETLIGQRSPAGETYTFTDGQVSRLTSYYYRVEAVDNVGNTASIESEKMNCGSQEIIGAGAPQARLKVSSVMEVGVDYLFDASESSDETGIASYRIDFGDGFSSDESKAVHRYENPGFYTVTLTVTDDDGNSTVLKTDIIVTVREAIGQVKVTVVNSNGAVLPNMPVYFDLGGGNQSIAYTGSSGSVIFDTVIGKFTVGTYADGYLPVKQEAVVTNGKVTEIKLVVVQQPIVTGEFEIHRMTLSEIIAAGIDVSAPENQNVVKITGYLYYGKENVPISFNANNKGIIDSKPIIKDFGDGTGKHSLTPVYIGSGYGSSSGSGTDSSPIIAIVDIPVEASFLKDFFDVKLHIMNHAAEEYSLLNNTITLNVPDGLTIVEANGRSSTAAVCVDEIKGQETYTANWVLRGDIPGEYEISANYFGVVSQFNAPVQAHFVAKDPIQVRDGAGLEILLDASTTLFQGNAYFDVGLHNSDRESTYIPDINVDGGILREIEFEDAFGVRKTITEIPQTLKPGETLWKRYYKQAEGNISPGLVLKNTLGQIAEKFGMPLILHSYPITYFLDFSELYPNSDAELNLEPGTYCIKVVDETTGLAVSGASVVTDKGSGTTDGRGMVILKLPEDNTLRELTVSKESYDTLKMQNLMLPADKIKVIYLKSDIPQITFADIPGGRDEIKGPYVDILGHKIPVLDIDVSVEIPGLGEVVKREVDAEKKTVRYAIGLDPSLDITPDPNDTYWRECYQDIKKTVKAFGGKVDTPKLWNQFSKLRGKLKKMSPNMGVNCEAYFMGFIEFDYSSGRLKPLDSGFLIGASAGVSYTYYPLPALYIKLSLTGDLDGNFHWTVSDSNVADFGGTLGLSLKPGLAAGGGIDKIASIEAGLEASINGELTFPFKTLKKSFKAWLGGEFYIDATALIFSKRLVEVDFGTLQIYPEFGKSSKTLTKLNKSDLQKDDLQILSRNYLTARFSKRSRAVGKQNVSYYQENVFPYGDPQLLDLGNGKQLLVWIGDNPQRSDVNRTQLYYTVYDGISWSQVQAVCDDGTADFAPRLCRDGDKVYLLWQNVESIMADSVTYDEMAKKIELSLSVFDGVAFSEPMTVNVPANTNCETMHTVTAKNGKVSVVWLENSENDPFLLTGTNSIYRRTFADGKWQDQECLKSELTPVIGLDADYDGSDCVVAYSIDADGDISTDKDVEIYLICGQQEERITEKNTNNSGLQFLNGVLYWNVNGVWMMKKDGITSELGLNAPTDAVILENGTQKAAIWKQVEGYKNELIVAYQNFSDKTWTTPVPLTNDGGNFRSLSALLKENGEIAYACNWAKVLKETPENELPFGTTDLIVMQGNTNCDLCLGRGIIYNDTAIQPGQNIPLKVEVCNNSLQSIENVDICITDENDVQVFNKTVACKLDAGETADINIDFMIPDPLTKQEWTITVIPAGLTDSDLSNNAAKFTAGEADLVLSEISLERVEDTVTLQGNVMNTGYDTAENVKAIIYLDGVYGEKIAEIPLENIAPEANAQITYKLPEDKCVFANENERKLFYVQIESESEEADYANNSASQVLEAVLAQEITVDQSAISLNIGNKAKVQAQIFPENAVNQTLAWVSDNTDVAEVDQMGQITAVGNGSANITVITSNGITRRITVQVGTEDFTMVMKYDSQYSVFNGNKITNTQYSGGYATVTLNQGVSMIPVRFLCEVTGMQVVWNENTQMVTVTNPSTGEYVSLTINNRTAVRYNRTGEKLNEWELSMPPQIMNGITMVPLRAVSECLGYCVEYTEKDYGTYVIVSSTPQTENIDVLCETAKKLEI